MLSYDLLKIFYPFIILVLLAAFYVIYFYKIKLMMSKYYDVIKRFQGRHEKECPVKGLFPEISVANRYCNYESNFDHLFSWNQLDVKCFLGVVSTHVISGWSFYSTVLIIEKSYKKNNIVVMGENLTSVYKFVRDLKARGAHFYLHPSDMAQMNWLNGEELKLLNSIFNINKRSMLDFYNGKLVITMGGRFKSCLLSSYQLSKLIEQLQRSFSRE